MKVDRAHPGQFAAFTLIELLAVVAVIAILASLTMGVAKYLSRQADVSKTKALIAKLELGIEAFKLDRGYYPTTSIYRCTPVDFHAEQANSAALYSQLMSPKKYITFMPGELGSNSAAGIFIMDAWETSINYYCPASNVPYQVSNSTNSWGVGYVPATNYYMSQVDSFTVGGLVNQMTYDLFSYGPDKRTAVPGCTYPAWPRGWLNSTKTAIDDIGNTKQ